LRLPFRHIIADNLGKAGWSWGCSSQQQQGDNQPSRFTAWRLFSPLLCQPSYPALETSIFAFLRAREAVS
jgi:hypothetical protein